MDSDSGPKPKNEYNDSLGYLGRINILWYKISYSRIEVKPNEWFNYLIAQYAELSTQMEYDENIDFINRIERIKEDLAAPFISDGAKTWLKQNIYDNLFKFELDLRQIWHRAGLDMKTGDLETDFSEYT